MISGLACRLLLSWARFGGVTTTLTGSNNYEQSQLGSGSSVTAPEADGHTFRLPLLFWAGVILFTVNALLILAIWLSPEMRVGMYGEQSDEAVSLAKPSPFHAEVQVAQVRKPRAPEKVRPVLVEEQPAEFIEAAMALDIPRSTSNLPRTSLQMARQTPSAVQVAESAADFPRMTASLMRTSAEQIVRSATVEVAPRRVTAQP